MTRIHLSFPTRDLAASSAFYAELFGVAPDKVHEDLVRFQPADVPISLSLVPGVPVATAVHQGIKLTDSVQVQSARARFEAAGLQMRSENTECCYAGLDRVWVHDPDGRPWEVYTVLDDQGVQLASSDGACCVPQKAETDEASRGSCC